MFNWLHLIKDTRGIKSWHITLGVIWTTIFGIKVLLGGVQVTVGALGSITTASISGSDYIMIITPWLAAMGFREYIEKCLQSSESSPPTSEKS